MVTISPLQKSTAEAIVNIFETGRIGGHYGQVTLLPGDTGHLTYGRSQTTLGSGNLHLLISRYCNTDDARLGDALEPYLQALADKDTRLDHDQALRGLLQRAGDDPVMQDVQDAFFDEVYWEPAVRSAEYISAETALGMAIIFDSRIHGSWHRIRDRTIAADGGLADVGEQTWFINYITTRRHWLANHSNAILNATVYRMDSFQGLIDDGNWDLALPFTVRGHVVDEAALAGGDGHGPANAPINEPADDGTQPILKLRSPMMQGDAVQRLQRALFVAGINVDTDGIFGPGTKKAVIQFQRDNGLGADGIVGPATWSRLEP